MAKSKYSHPQFPTVTASERGDTSRDESKMDRQGRSGSAAPSSGSHADKQAAGTLGKPENR